MIRTRDFLLFVLAAGFLLVAIATTAAWNHRQAPAVMSMSAPVAANNVMYTAEVAAVIDTKSERLAALRKKLAEDTSFEAPTETITDTSSDIGATTTLATEEVISAPVDTTVMLCGTSYSSKYIPGLTGQQQYEERDGQRIFFETVLPLDPGTTTPATPPAEKMIFTLPLRTVPLPTTSCIKDDIVAVSQTGVLIRNADYAKYQSSGESTLIGYTIDGFPLYGRTNSMTTDACGGAMIDGSYRYYMSAERKGVLGCFAGIPAAL